MIGFKTDLDSKCGADVTTRRVRRSPVLGQTRQSACIVLDEDPYLLNPKETLQLLDLFFAQQESTKHFIYPQWHFMDWVKNCTSKHEDDTNGSV
jgi:hypothetical protein